MRDIEDTVEDIHGVGPRDAEVLRAIEDEGLSVFTFDGLRRITGTHPETLSRSLERLEENGAIVKSPEGYSTAGKMKWHQPHRPASAGPKSMPVLHTYLPFPSSTSKIVGALKGRWFDNVRWVGMAEGEGELVMKWVTDDGTALIDAKFTPGQLDIEAKVSKDSDLPKAVRAAHQLVGRISRLYGGTRPGSRTAFTRTGYVAPYAM